MKRYLFIIILFVCAAVPMTAQYYSVNYDKRTVAEMTAAFASEAATEAYYAEQVAKIREYYQACERASAAALHAAKIPLLAIRNKKLLHVFHTTPLTP